MHWPTVKWILIRVIPGIALAAVAVLMFNNAYAPSPTALEYLYSSVFQGLAALVAVSLAIVVYVSDRLETSMGVHLADAQKTYNQFYSTDSATLVALGPDDLEKGLRKWFLATVEPRRVTLDRVYSSYRATPAAGRRHYISLIEAIELKPLTEEFQRLRSYESNLRVYDDSASHLGRYRQAQRGWSSLPKSASLAFAWSLTTIMLAMLLLATVDYSGPESSNWTITAVAAALLSVIYMAMLFRTLMNAYFGSSRIRGFKESGLPDSTETWQLLKEIELFYTTHGIWFG